ncbi:hypothetical protein ACJZ2D_016342 [Fusarium nematophilum]
MESLATFLTNLGLSRSAAEELTDRVVQLQGSTSCQPHQDSTAAAALVIGKLFPASITYKNDEGYAAKRDVNCFNQITIEDNRQVARVGSVCRWGQVYNELDKCDLVVAGARYADVGCGGLLTGCGTSPFLGLTGFSSDGVLNFEVITSDGQTLNANTKENSELFWALKGGSNNFGIVTHFDLAIIQVPGPILSGALIYPPNKIGDVISVPRRLPRSRL